MSQSVAVDAASSAGFALGCRSSAKWRAPAISCLQSASPRLGPGQESPVLLPGRQSSLRSSHLDTGCRSKSRFSNAGHPEPNRSYSQHQMTVANRQPIENKRRSFFYSQQKMHSLKQGESADASSSPRLELKRTTMPSPSELLQPPISNL
jgi:hypothetical protein